LFGKCTDYHGFYAAFLQFDVREDEEQGVKLNQIVELLLAAGYFRARIKGLSPFDKVITNSA
jgi:CCDC93, coiled-coil domain